MKVEAKIPETYLENINMINSATNFSNLFLKSNFNITKNDNSKFDYSYNKTNGFYKTQNDISTNMPSTTQKFFFNSKKNFMDINPQEFNFPNNYNLNKLNSKKKFAWKEIMNNNNELILDDKKELDNPLIKNILNSNLDEKEIQNTPQNYLANLIQTLQGMANQVLKNKNNLEKENQKLCDDILEAKNNYNYMKENNDEMIKSRILLKQQNNEQKNLIKNFENKNILYEFDKLESKNIQLNNYLEKYNFKKKYYCKLCTNKAFKSKYYLDSHIKRRHNEYYQSYNKKENQKIKKNIINYSKKLNEFKKSYESLVNANFKKYQYMKLNEKIKGLENLILMSKGQEDIINSIMIKANLFSNGQDILGNNINKENNDKLNSKEENEKLEFQNHIKALRKDMTHYLNKVRTEIMEINREKKFQKIKRYFEKEPKPQFEYNSPTHQRKNQKIKTIKAENININMFNEKKNEMNQSYGEIKKEQEPYQSMKNSKTQDILKAQNEVKNIEAQNINEKDNYNNINENEINTNIYNNNNNIVNMNINLINGLKPNNLDENDSKRSIKYPDSKISFDESENLSNKNDITLKKFYDEFRERDKHFSYGEKEFYTKSIIPNDYQIDKTKMENLVEEKINQKLNKFDQNNDENLVQEILNLNYKMLDAELNGIAYCFYSRNISMLMDTKKLINETNNYYYHFMKLKDMKSLEDRNREANQNPFETVNYIIKNLNSSEDSQNIINNNPNNESSFSLKNNK